MADNLGEVLQNQQNTNTQLSPSLGENLSYLTLVPISAKIKITTITVKRRYVNDSFILGDSVKGLLGMGIILDSMETNTNWTGG